MISRASTSSGTPPSIAATMTVSAFESPSRPIVISRAMVRADGVRLRAPSVFSACRAACAHSVTTRRQPRKPCFLSRRQSSAPLRCPAAHCASSHGRWSSSELSRRGRRRSADRAEPCGQAAAVAVRRTISLIGDPVLGQPENDGVGLFPAQIALVLEPLGGGEQVGIDRGRADRAAGSAAWICAPHRGRRGWHSPSDASGRRPGWPGAVPWLPPGRSRRRDRGRRSRSAAGPRARPGPSPARDPAAVRSSCAVRDRRRSSRSAGCVAKPSRRSRSRSAGRSAGVPRRRTTRSSVSLLTGSISRRAKLAAGRPPKASPR